MNKTVKIQLKSRDTGVQFNVELTAPADVIDANCGNGGGPSLEDLIGDVFDADVVQSYQHFA